MAYHRYPVERRSNRPEYVEERQDYHPGQPASRTRFYRDKRNGKVMGICAGIADYTGFDVAIVRICMIAALFLSSGSILPLYFIAGWVTPTKPRELEVGGEEKQFWQGVRASPARAARDIRSRMKDIDRRLADIESYVTTENRSLAREIDALAADKGGSA
jgi:phage shock protein C